VVAKVEWHPGELYPRVGFIVTNLARPAERVVAFYNQRGTAEQCINLNLAEDTRPLVDKIIQMIPSVFEGFREVSRCCEGTKRQI
jgi:hypothetical protein